MQHDDKVWFDSKRRFEGICAEVRQFANENQNVLLLAHFQATLSILQASLRTAAIKFSTFSTADSSLLCSHKREGRVLSGLVRAFQPSSLSEQANESGVEIIVVEHHPMMTRDRDLVEAAKSLPCSSSVCFHTSLDDPFMRLFVGDNLVSLVKRIGADESDFISHPFVTNSIRNAQEKIEKKAQGDMPTESIEDWFKYNLP